MSTKRPYTVSRILPLELLRTFSFIIKIKDNILTAFGKSFSIEIPWFQFEVRKAIKFFSSNRIFPKNDKTG